MNKFSRLYVLISWAFAIFILLTFPTPEYIGTKITLQDKFAHAFLFGVFAWLVFYVLTGYKANKKDILSDKDTKAFLRSKHRITKMEKKQ